MVSSAVSRACSQPSEMMFFTKVGSSVYSRARSTVSFCSARMASITGCLQSRQPILAVRHPSQGPGVLVGIHFVQIPNRALFRLAGIRAPLARRVGGHGAQPLLHALGIVAQQDDIVVGLGHLLAVEPRQPGCRRQHGVRLGEDDAPAALQVAEQPLLLAEGQVAVVLEDGLGLFERLGVAALHVGGAQLVVQARALLAQLAGGQPFSPSSRPYR